LNEEKGKISLKMLKRAVKNSILADYVLMNSWFISDYILKAILSIRGGMLHIVGMCKIDRRKFKVGNTDKSLLIFLTAVNLCNSESETYPMSN
jgi:hypothetical protein